MSAEQTAHTGQDRRDRSAALLLALLVTGLLLVLKAALAWMGGSLALWSDTGHSLADVIFLGSAWIAARIAQRPASDQMTWGYPRVGVLVGLLSAIGLVAMSALLLVESWLALLHPTPPVAWTMLVGGGAGLVANLAVGLRLQPHEAHTHQDLNLRSAWLHVLGDAATSLAVIVAALVMMWTRFWAADAIGAMLIAVVVAVSSLGIIRDAWAVLMEATPPDVHLGQVLAALQAMPGVASVHHVHVWTLTPGESALSAHVRLADAQTVADGQVLIRAMDRELAARFGIRHSTLQLEVSEEDEPGNHEHIVGQPADPSH